MSLPGGTRRSRTASSRARSSSSSARSSSSSRPRSLAAWAIVLGRFRMFLLLPVARLGDVVDVGERLGPLGAEDLADLGERPDVVLALDALAVGVLGRVEAPFGVGHPAEDVIHRLAGDAGERRVAGRLVGLEVDRGEQGVVVEHLLEVRDEPALVGRVAGEAAAEVVVDAAAGHLVERVPDHVQRVRVAGPRVLAEQDLQVHRVRELGRGAEAAVRGSNARASARAAWSSSAASSAPVGRQGLPGRPELLGHPARRPGRPRPAARPRPGARSRSTRGKPGIPRESVGGK